MEEKKLNIEQEEKEPRALSYEDLHKVAVQLSRENEQLRRGMQEAKATLGSINRLDILMRVIEINNHANKYSFSDDFISSCISEVEELITLPKEVVENKDNNSGSN